MNRTVAAVCSVVLVLVLSSEKCFSLEYNLETSENVRNVLSDDSDLEAETPDSYDVEPQQNWKFHPVFGKLFGSDDDRKEDVFEKIDGASKRRVVRQAYQGQTQLYPNLPSGPPYGLQPYSNYNIGNQHPSPNQSQSGYPSQINGYQPNYTSSNFTNNKPSGPYGQNSQPNPWQPNGYQSNTNNPYGTNTQFSHNNHTQPGYPTPNGYKPSNFTYNNPSGPSGQNPPPNSWQSPYQPNNGQRPYNPSNGSYPSYNNNPQNPYPGYKPANTYNNSSSRPPYNQPGQPQNNSYSAYPSHGPGITPSPYPYNPNQNPQYYPGQSQLNNTRYPQNVPGNQHPVINDSTKRPGQNPYGSYNVSNWSGNTFNNTQGTPYNSQNPYGTPANVPNNGPPFQNTQFGQTPSNSYPGHSANGYNPNIPNKPPYGNESPYGNGPYGNGPYGNRSPNYYPNGTINYPTRVSPGNYNSY